MNQGRDLSHRKPKRRRALPSSSGTDGRCRQYSDVQESKPLEPALSRPQTSQAGLQTPAPHNSESSSNPEPSKATSTPRASPILPLTSSSLYSPQEEIMTVEAFLRSSISSRRKNKYTYQGRGKRLLRSQDANSEPSAAPEDCSSFQGAADDHLGPSPLHFLRKRRNRHPQRVPTSSSDEGGPSEIEHPQVPSFSGPKTPSPTEVSNKTTGIGKRLTRKLVGPPKKVPFPLSDFHKSVPRPIYPISQWQQATPRLGNFTAQFHNEDEDIDDSLKLFGGDQQEIPLDPWTSGNSKASEPRRKRKIKEAIPLTFQATKATRTADRTKSKTHHLSTGRGPNGSVASGVMPCLDFVSIAVSAAQTRQNSAFKMT